MREPGEDAVAAGTDAGFFDTDYRRVLAPLYSEADTRREVAAIRELTGLAQSDDIVDIGCGWGRHLRLLRDAGHRVIGLDLSLPLLRQAADHRRPPLVQADMRALPLASGAFDVVLNLNTSLGLFLGDAAAVEALTETRRALRPGGLLLMEGMHRDEVVARFASRDRWWLEDGTEVRARRRFDPLTGVSEEVLRWRDPQGTMGAKRHRLRLRTATETRELLARAGLAVRSVWGDWEGGALRRLSSRLIVLAERSD